MTDERMRQSPAAAPCEEPEISLKKKLQTLQVATRHQFPVSDIEQMLAEIEAGYIPD